MLNVLLKLYILLKSQKLIKKSDFEKHSDLILIHTTIIFFKAASIEKYFVSSAYKVGKLQTRQTKII